MLGLGRVDVAAVVDATGTMTVWIVQEAYQPSRDQVLSAVHDAARLAAHMPLAGCARAACRTIGAGRTMPP